MNLPNPPAWQPGQTPQAGQWAPYKKEKGTLRPGFIIAVEESSPDGKYWNLEAGFLKENGSFEIGRWVGEVATAQILYVPAGPPFP
jgi:hypothetical protein